MKIFLSIIIIATCFSLAKAQPPNFTQTDIYGNTFNLYNQLDLGKVVVLDFYAIN